MSLAKRQEGVTLTVCCLLTSLLREKSRASSLASSSTSASTTKYIYKGAYAILATKAKSTKPKQRPDTCEEKEISAPDFLLVKRMEGEIPKGVLTNFGYQRRKVSATCPIELSAQSE